MHIALAPFRLKEGISEDALVKTSDDFEEQFVRKQEGILKRILVKDGNGGYADIVFFADAAAIDRVIEAEQSSEVCAAFFAIMDEDGTHSVYEMLKTYER
ncbi:hypothetical protein [Catellatospora sp. NPDC049609]|uniref:hypothetical protein n=1 Tax=Catellatospora sp. NPDC049609 TaxID=3155505 RepID=UPI0034305F94